MLVHSLEQLHADGMHWHVSFSSLLHDGEHAKLLRALPLPSLTCIHMKLHEEVHFTLIFHSLIITRSLSVVMFRRLGLPLLSCCQVARYPWVRTLPCSHSGGTSASLLQSCGGWSMADLAGQGPAPCDHLALHNRHVMAELEVSMLFMTDLFSRQLVPGMS